MHTNRLKQALARGEAQFGAWLMLGGTGIARMLGGAGFDWVLIDTEHGTIDQAMMAEMVAAVASVGGVPLVRVTANSPELIKRALDAGAWGIIVPMVNNAAEAEAVVRAAKFPPQGERGYGSPFARFPFAATPIEYTAEANANIVVVVQIETVQAIAAVDDIAAVPGLDVLFVGPNDLSASYGLVPGNENNAPEFQAALERVKAAARDHHIACGIFAPDGELAARRAAEGFQMVSATIDFAAMLDGAGQQLARVKTL